MKFTLSLGISLLLASPSWADTTLRIPGLSPDATLAPTDCRNIPGSPESCSRVLACIGEDGLYFDGRAIGWDIGRIEGALSDGTACTGTWDSTLRTGGVADAICEDGTEVGVLYTQIDGRTGTVIGNGMDNRNRRVEAWTGELVLQFLTPEGKTTAELPCGETSIPIS